MAFAWSSALALGVPVLDEQHEELFRRFGRLEDAILARDRTEAPRLLAYLIAYAREHFAAEEALMREVGYPDLERHAAEHRAFAREIERLDLAHARDGSSAALVLRLDLDVGGWLRDHIYASDVALARFVQARRWTTRTGEEEGGGSPEGGTPPE
jgi:hemerythrin-like metal-binding protein